jgi:hypothetical protein
VGTRDLDDPATSPLDAVGASLGRVAVAAVAASRRSGERVPRVLQGHAGEPSRWSGAAAGSGPPFALARAYLGDVALAAVAPGPQIEVRVERYFQGGFGPPRSIPIPAGRVSSLTATMDYRSDVLLAWQQNGSVYARMLRASGRPDPTQRVGPSGPDPQIEALVSDNDHGMLAWSSTDAGGRTRVYLDLSAAEVRFGAPQLLASFADPQRAGESPGSIRLRRLSTENVELAWTTAQDGHYSVHVAPAVYATTRAVTLSDPASQAILDDLAPGPIGEAVALWSTAPAIGGGSLETSRSRLWAARTSIIAPDHVVARAARLLAPAGPNVEAALAVDPASDRAVAVWRTLSSSSGAIRYALSGATAGYRPHPGAVASPPSRGAHWLRITLAVIAGLAALGLALALVARRRRQAG